MEDTTLTGRGGAGRGQGRKPIAADAKPYKLLLPADHREKLDQLGGAEWIRTQLAFAIHLDNLNLEKAVNLSARYIEAMRQLPQFFMNLDHRGPLTDVRTGARIVPLGDLTDEDDETDMLQIAYPGGHSIEVSADRFFRMAVADGARLEVATMPEELGITPRKQSPEQQRIADQLEHLTRKHGLQLD